MNTLKLHQLILIIVLVYGMQVRALKILLQYC